MNDTKQKTALRAISVTSKSEGSSRFGMSSNATPNPWTQIEDTYGLIEPPFDLFGLSNMVEYSTELGQCVEAMEINVGGFGWRLRELPEVRTPETARLVDEELARFKELIEYSDYSGGSFVNLRRRTRKDLELTGNAYWEVIRDSSGRVSAFNHVPSWMIKMSPVEESPILVKEFRAVGTGDGREIKEVLVSKRFRRFGQVVENERGTHVVFFKEYGDPRDLDWRSGRFANEGEVLRQEERASELLHWKIYSPRSPYGIPRYIGALLSIQGNRSAEEINFQTFKNNNIPSMALLVSNGMLSDGSVDRVQSFVEESISSSTNFSRFLILEAEGVSDTGDSVTAKLDIKPLTQTQHTDALFQNYTEKNEARVRRAFRLPPIFVGRADEYTRSTAETSRKLADEQIFGPERQEDDFQLNRLFSGLGMIYHRFETNSPNVTNDSDLIAVLQGAEKTGGATPRISRKILEDILGTELGGFSDRIDPDLPFSLQVTEAMKYQGPSVGKSSETPLEKRLPLPPAPEGMSDSMDVVLDLGERASQAFEEGLFVTPLMMNVDGRTFLISDGSSIIGRIQFGSSEEIHVDSSPELFKDHPERRRAYLYRIERSQLFTTPLPFVGEAGLSV